MSISHNLDDDFKLKNVWNSYLNATVPWQLNSEVGLGSIVQFEIQHWG